MRNQEILKQMKHQISKVSLAMVMAVVIVSVASTSASASADTGGLVGLEASKLASAKSY